MAHRLKKDSKGKREKPLNVDEWLKRPHANMTREEGWVLLRQWHYEIERSRILRNPFLFVPWAIGLILSLPFKLIARGARAILKRGEEEE